MVVSCQSVVFTFWWWFLQIEYRSQYPYCRATINRSFSYLYNEIFSKKRYFERYSLGTVGVELPIPGYFFSLKIYIQIRLRCLIIFAWTSFHLAKFKRATSNIKSTQITDKASVKSPANHSRDLVLISFIISPRYYWTGTNSVCFI